MDDENKRNGKINRKGVKNKGNLKYHLLDLVFEFQTKLQFTNAKDYALIFLQLGRNVKDIQ